MRFVSREPREIVLKAGPRRKATRTYARVSVLANQMQKPIQVNLVKGIKQFRRKIKDSELFEAWRTGNYHKVMEVIPWQDLPSDLAPVTADLEGVVDGIAKFTIPKLSAPVREELRFDTANPYIRRFLSEHSAQLVTSITEGARENIQNQVTRSLDEALRPNQISSMIKNGIGLYPKLEGAVDRYRRGLELTEVNPNRVDQLTNAYYDRLLDYRSMMIARTETRFATNYGQLSIWRNAADLSLINRDTAKKVWIVDGDPCEICEPMDGVAVPLDSVWALNNGDVVDIPTESHPHCLCGMELETGEAEEEA